MDEISRSDTITDEQLTNVATVVSIDDEVMVVVDFNNKKSTILKSSLGSRIKIQNAELPEAPNYDVISFANDLPVGSKFSKRIPEEYNRKNAFGRIKKEMGEDVTEGIVTKNNGSIIAVKYHRESPHHGISNLELTVSREDFIKAGYEYTSASQNSYNNMPYPTEGFNGYSQNSSYVG